MYCITNVWCISSDSKLQAQFKSMEVRNHMFAAFIDTFTANTYVMVIMTDSSIRKEWLVMFCVSNFLCITASAATLVNIRNARKHFEKVEKLDGTTVIPKSLPKTT